MLITTILMAFREIRRNAMRSLLTMLGVIIGVGSVIALVTLGDGATAKIRDNISSLGNNLLIVTPNGKPFSEADSQTLARELAGLERVASTASASLKVVSGSKNWKTTITGATADFLSVRNFEIARGPDAVAALATPRPVCILGATPAKELFGSQDPLGQTIRAGRMSCTIIGLLKAKGASSFGNDNDDVILMPLRAYQQRIGGSRAIYAIYATAKPGRATSTLKAQIEQLFRQRRQLRAGEDNDFRVHDMQEIIKTVSTTTGLMTALLGAVAAVSLLVGGIGIMNIMLVSVTERTREIGTRLAIGALGSDVLLQFLIEAVTLSSLGGLIGVILGLLGAFAGAKALNFPFMFSPSIVVLAFLFSAGVGVIFGYLPARKAAKFNPIDALRYE